MVSLERLSRIVPGSLSLRSVLVLTALFVALVHGLLVLNDGVYWDGWIIYGHYLNGDFKPVWEMFRDAGNPGFALFHLLMWQTPLPLLFSYKLVAFISIVVSATLLAGIYLRSRLLSPPEAIFASAIAVCYTAFQAWVEISIIPYLVCYCLFIIASYLTLFPVRTSRLTHGLSQFVAVVCFLISFNLASLIAFFWVLIPPLVILERRRSGRWIPQAWSERFRYAGFAALPLLFVASKSVWGTTSGLYRDYNQIRLSWQVFRDLSYVFVDSSLGKQFANAIAFLLTYWLGVLIICCAICVISRFWPRPSRHDLETPPARWLTDVYLAIYSLAVLVLAVTPYVLVGKPALADGFETRHALLVGLPVGLGLVVLGRFVCRELRPGSQIVPICGMLLLVVFGGMTWKNYILWELRWIKDRSTIAALSRDPEAAKTASYVFFDDPYLIHNQQYLFYEYSGMMKLAFGDERRLGNTAQEETGLKRLARDFPLKRYLLANFDGQGCSALVAKRFTYPLSWRTVVRYYWNRFTNAQKLGQFLADGTTLTWFDISQKRLDELRAIEKAVREYRAERGSYPHAAQGVSLDMKSLSTFLVPKFLKELPVEPRASTYDNIRYEYFSDGKTFKIISHNPEDTICVARRHPEMMDPRRPDYAYGFWDDGAQSW